MVLVLKVIITKIWFFVQVDVPPNDIFVKFFRENDNI